MHWFAPGGHTSDPPENYPSVSEKYPIRKGYTHKQPLMHDRLFGAGEAPFRAIFGKNQRRRNGPMGCVHRATT